MFITFLFNLYFPCGITKKPLHILHNKAFPRTLRAAFLNHHVMEIWRSQKKKAIKTATSQIYEKINTPFKNIFGVTFAKAQTTVSDFGLEDKKSHAERKKERGKKSTVDKSCIQQKWSEKDCDTMVSTRQTYSQRQEQRSSLFFESPEDAEQRANKRKQQEDEGQRKKKRHSPRPEDLDFDKDGLLEKVNAMRDGERVSKTYILRK